MRSPANWRGRASKSYSPCPAFSSTGPSMGLRKISNRIALVGTRHEQATSYMADGYARASGKVGVCLVVPGPGVLNAMAGLSTAYACNSRVLCIAGDIFSPTVGKGLGLLHEVRDQTGILAAVTKWQGRASRAEDVPKTISEAFAQLRASEPKPVAVQISHDVLSTAAEIDLQRIRSCVESARPFAGADRRRGKAAFGQPDAGDLCRRRRAGGKRVGCAGRVRRANSGARHHGRERTRRAFRSSSACAHRAGRARGDAACRSGVRGRQPFRRHGNGPRGLAVRCDALRLHQY